MYSKKALLSAFALGSAFTVVFLDVYIKYNDEFKIIKITKKD